MMHQNLKKYLEFDKEIFDIVLYGSIVKGKKCPEDVDILVIFLNADLKKRLDIIQNIKFDLIKNEIFSKKIDIKQLLLKDLFMPEFFAKTGVIIEGISVFSGKPFSNRLGFEPFVLFNYSLDGLGHTEKVKFNYILSGRNGPGILKEFNANRIAPGVIKVPISRSIDFENIFENNNIKFRKSNILEEVF